MILDMVYIMPFENDLEKMLDKLVEIFSKQGLYSSIVASNPYILNTLYHLCEALDIDLYEGKTQQIDDIYDDLKEMLMEKEVLMS
ncbi:MAG: hypothetical protein SPJ09_04655, partial [Erysipelotrichaceae bacterium]|nr:hypothetical protein [Erysipelotrichaceae bacterium]